MAKTFTDQELLDSSFWQRYGMDSVLNPLVEKMVDPKDNLFHMAFNEDWSPKSKNGKTPWVIARQLFSLAAAYMQYGDEKYMEMAKPSVKWLLEYAWDVEYGGWFELIDSEGQPLETHKTEFNHLYIETGLAFYYFVTKDQKVLDRIEVSSKFHNDYFWEPGSGGYVRELHRDGSIKTSCKDFCGQFVPLSGPWIYMYLATRDEAYLQKINRIITTAMPRMVDKETGWVLERFDKDWNYDPKQTGNTEVDLGHNMEIVFCFLRIYQLTGDKKLLQEGLAQAELCIEKGYDKDHHLWPWKMNRIPGEKNNITNWWVQEYGNFINLYLYKTTGEQKYLDLFLDTARFYMNHFIDQQHGGEHLQVEIETADKVLKRNHPESGYHSTEHALLVSAYLDLFVHKQPTKLYFLVTAKAGEKHYLSPIETPDAHVTEVKINGEAWKDFNAEERSVILPEGENMKIEVTLEVQA